MIKSRILLLEDEPQLASTVSEYLNANSLHCDVFTNCQGAIKNLTTHNYEVAILDIDLPDGSGMDVGKLIRSHSPTTIILFASAINDPSTKLECLEMGAQDFITKPFHLKELQLRLLKILTLKEKLGQSQNEIHIGKLTINFASFWSKDASGQQINWSHKECSILKILYDAKGRVVPRDEIIDLVWGEDAFPSHRTVDNYIVSLRKWAETDPSKSLVITSIRGVGYKLEIK
jgi:two-component system alkaline phosphatase synthesis response regulator PhoP